MRVDVYINIDKLIITTNQTITASYSAYVSGYCEIADTITLDILDGAVFEIG